MLKLSVSVSGKTDGDIAVALHEIMSQLDKGFTRGMDSNDDGEYSFDLSGEEEAEGEQNG